MPRRYPSDVAFSESVKKVQQRLGSRDIYERIERGEGWTEQVTAGLAGILAGADSFYLGTAGADGQPYIQHRGGPPGFLKVIDDHTLGFADYYGNQQYITAGNLDENGQAIIFMMNYPARQRIKIWGTADRRSIRCRTADDAVPSCESRPARDRCRARACHRDSNVAAPVDN